ncbi:hypothetical protein COCVIDRAFT_117075, partial [Bipolaris victoriae FI3]
QPFASAIVYFLTTLSIYLETSCLRIATKFLPILSSLVYYVRALVIEFFLLVDK